MKTFLLVPEFIINYFLMSIMFQAHICWFAISGVTQVKFETGSRTWRAGRDGRMRQITPQ